MTTRPTKASLRADLEEVIYTGCLFLDRLQFGAWFELAAPDLRYRIQAYSPDIRKEMTWLDHDRKGLAAILAILPKHHVDGAQWLRHAVLYTATQEADDRARAVTSLAIYHTVVDVGDAHIEGGSSRLFAVGRYHDQFRLEGGRWLLVDRAVKLETRQLGIGSHLIP